MKVIHLIKNMLKNLALTALTITVIGKFFLSSLLGLFGYSAIPLESLQKLNASKQIVDKMKTRHKTKKVNASKKFYKKAGKKVSVTAVSAATLGTIAVVGTLTYLEVSQYCEEQKELVDEENILFSTDKSFDNQACLSRAKEDSIAITDEAIEAIKAASLDVADKFIDSANELLEPSRQELIKIFEYIDSSID
tara:strand:- start:24 stop:602 length:579 start_codon:yes stop_codon:yes gene_type:complete